MELPLRGAQTRNQRLVREGRQQNGWSDWCRTRCWRLRGNRPAQALGWGPPNGTTIVTNAGPVWLNGGCRCARFSGCWATQVS